MQPRFAMRPHARDEASLPRFPTHGKPDSGTEAQRQRGETDDGVITLAGQILHQRVKLHVAIDPVAAERLVRVT